MKELQQFLLFSTDISEQQLNQTSTIRKTDGGVWSRKVIFKEELSMKAAVGNPKREKMASVGSSLSPVSLFDCSSTWRGCAE